MSVTLSINEIPDALASRLRVFAQRNHRSLQGKLMAIIKDAACEPSVMWADSQRCPPARPADRKAGYVQTLLPRHSLVPSRSASDR